MKKILTIVLLGFALATMPGCKNPTATAYKSESALITSVDTAMKVWHDRVVAGKATQAQMDLVKKSYQTYYNAQQVAKAALELYISNTSTNTASASANAASARQAVSDAASALVSLVTLYTSK